MIFDQADRLRDMVSAREPSIPEKLNARVIAVTSGKGGVGKSNFTVNLAIFLQRHNKRVVIMDTDFGLANVEILFGVFPKSNLGDVLMGEKTIVEALTDGPGGIKFVSAGSGLKDLVNITERQVDLLIDCMAQLDNMFDVILIDTGAGASHAVVNFIKTANECIIVTTPEPTSVTDAYSLVKTLRDGEVGIETVWDGPELKVVLNRVENSTEGSEVFEKLKRVSQRFLNVELSFLGAVFDDGDLVKAVKRQQPAVIAFPNSVYARAIEVIGGKLLDLPAKKQTNLKSFVKRLAGVFGGR